MADPLLSSADWPAVRAALDITLDANALPDATIALDIYSGRAMREVEARIEGATALTGDDELKVTAAAVLLTAAKIAPAMPALTRGKAQYLEYQREGMDWSKRSAELRAMAESEIAELLEPTATVTFRPTMMARAQGRRGK